MKVACLEPKLSQFIHTVPISIAPYVTKAKKTSENVLGTTSSQFTESIAHCNANSQKENAKQRVDQVSRSQTVAQSAAIDKLGTMPATQEIGIAFILLHEMRHKLTDGFKELMRISI
jgi:flagellar hook-basal body complex protein FliE